jgi:hypothetical protein
MVVMALSTSSPRAMISAPSEMRCRSMSAICMTGNTIASVSGKDSATTRPARPPSDAKLITRMIAIACQREIMNSLIASSTTSGWFATSTGVMPTGRSAVISWMAASTLVPSAEDVAALAHGDGEPDRRLAVDPEHRCRRVGVAAAYGGYVAQPQQPAVGDEVRLEDVLLGLEGAGHPQREFLVAGAHHARRAHHVLRAQSREDGRLVEAEAGEPLGGELDEDLLVLGAEQVDLGHVGQQQQPRARVLDVVAQLAVREAVRGEP